jgi:hypothetical protein
MQAFHNATRRSLARKAMTALAGIVLTTAVATGALAAGHRAGVGHSSHSHGMRGGFRAPLFNSAPSTAPTVNPSYGYTVPQAPETPVSPGSPGSVFGDH